MNCSRRSGTSTVRRSISASITSSLRQLVFRYHEDGSKKLTHAACSSCAWFIFNLNTKSRYSRIIYYSINTSDEIRSNPIPHHLSPSILLTWRTSFLACGLNIHPLLSWFAINCPTLCCFAHPSTPHRSSYNIYKDESTISAVLV